MQLISMCIISVSVMDQPLKNFLQKKTRATNRLKKFFLYSQKKTPVRNHFQIQHNYLLNNIIRVIAKAGISFSANWYNLNYATDWTIDLKGKIYK